VQPLLHETPLRQADLAEPVMIKNRPQASRETRSVQKVCPKGLSCRRALLPGASGGGTGSPVSQSVNVVSSPLS
jgi:hypothetical protein